MGLSGQTAVTMEILQSLTEFIRQMDEIPLKNSEPCNIEEFILLLSGISTYRKTPGISKHMGYERLYICQTENEEQQVKKHLSELYQIDDFDSLFQTCLHFYRSGEEYDQFLTFWNGSPCFDASKLNEKGKESFESSMEYAKIYRPYVENRGFYAWDCNERIGLCRRAVACGIITKEEFWDLCEPWAKRASHLHNSWKEYAISCLCGSIYFMHREYNIDNNDVKGFYNINKMVLEQLLFKNPIWAKRKWFYFDQE